MGRYLGAVPAPKKWLTASAVEISPKPTREMILEDKRAQQTEETRRGGPGAEGTRSASLW